MDGHGRPPHEPTDTTRRIARTLSGYGIPQEQIASEIGVSVPTLHKHYREDLDAGLRQANAQVAQSLFRKATGDGPQSVSAAIFWAKTRMGWVERTGVEITGKDGGPVQIDQDTARDRIQRRIDRLAAGLPLLPAAVERDVAETEAGEDVE